MGCHVPLMYMVLVPIGIFSDSLVPQSTMYATKCIVLKYSIPKDDLLVVSRLPFLPSSISGDLQNKLSCF